WLFEGTFPRGRGKFFPMHYTPAVEMPNEEFPFILTTGRVLEHWHGGTMTRHSALDDLYPEARVEIHPADATQLGIHDGDPVRVSSRRGSVVVRAWVGERATMGVVFLPFHFAEAAANLLTIDAIDPQAKIPEYKACAVRIAPAREAELPDAEAVQARGRY
ncbi:MAG: molybdopterin oxidoreductase family protein, partial [Caldilineaceae bacterium]